uniref:Elongation factor Ts, mitochondrial n=1 Tax=Apophlaea sinclairii TaxID=212746 RepID=A0A1C9CBH1_9FLOR|nr:elongation factor Ts [Apophlaea sinclairii]AOM65731.1 elongation factor Ts [Apophlaea sinclairii]
MIRMQISAKDVKELRKKTGAGMMACKQALQASNGNIDIAVKDLQRKGTIIANRKANRLTVQGLIESYIHLGAKIGVLVELNCETDFVARRLEFQVLAKNLAMQIAASPGIRYIDKTDIPEEVFNNERKAEVERHDRVNKPETIKQQVVNGKIAKKLSELTLLAQPFIKNSEITIDDLIKKHISLLGENIKVRRFVRFALGDITS